MREDCKMLIFSLYYFSPHFFLILLFNLLDILGIAVGWTLDTVRLVIRRYTRCFEVERCCSTWLHCCHTVRAMRNSCSVNGTLAMTSLLSYFKKNRRLSART